MPEIVPAEGSILTVIEKVATAVPQLLETIYEIVLLPLVIPVTVPELFTVAMEDTLLLQVPPLMPPLDDNVIAVPPTHNDAAPEIVPATGSGLTVIVEVAIEVPQLFVSE